MKKLAIALILSISATCVFAQSYYQRAVAKQQMCREVGQFGVEAFDLRVAGERRQKVVNATNEILYETAQYAYDSATDRKDAYSHGWATCMDNFQN